MKVFRDDVDKRYGTTASASTAISFHFFFLRNGRAIGMAVVCRRRLSVLLSVMDVL